MRRGARVSIFAGGIGLVRRFADVLVARRSAAGVDVGVGTAAVVGAGALAGVVALTGASGDGAVNVGLIDASGVDLRSVAIEGALERISVGDNDPSVRGIGLTPKLT